MKKLFALLILTFAAPLAAQDLGTAPPPVEEVETLEDQGGLTGSVTDTSDWQDLGIAIAGFATDRDTQTAANASGIAILL